MKIRSLSAVALSLLALSLFTTRSVADVIATDNAGTYTTFAGTENGGTGFGAWNKTTQNNAGTFLDGTSADIRTNNKSWGTFANGAASDNVVVYRQFNNSLAVGNSFTIRLDNNGINTGDSMGFVLKSNNTFTGVADYNNGSRFEYLFVGGESNYSYVDSTGRQQTAVGFRSTGQTVTVVVTGTNTFNLYLNDAAGTTSLGSVTNKTFTGSGAITSFDIYNRNSENDQYFNNVSVYNPEYTAGAGNLSTAASFQNSSKVLDGNNLIFSGTGGAVNNDLSNANANFGNVQQLNNLQFKAGSGAYTLSGNALKLNGGIDNLSSNLQTVNTNLTLGAAQSFNAGTAGLDVGGTVANGGNLLTVSGTGNTALKAGVSGAGGLTKTGTGTLTLSANNGFTGATTINASGGKIDAAAAGALGGTTSITVNTGGTLLLSNSGTTDRINNAATMTLAAGSTLNSGGLSEGTRPSGPAGSGGVAGIGALTLQGTSPSHVTLDFGTINGSTLDFSSLAAGANTFVDILNWTGTAGFDNGSATNDRWLFASNPGLSNAQLSNFNFSGFAPGATIFQYGGQFEIVPVPEPSTWAAGILTVLAVAYTQRRRLRTLATRAPAQAA